MRFIAIVDDDDEYREVLQYFLNSKGFEAEGYCDGLDFLERYTPRRGCVLLNIRMPRLGGIETLKRMNARGWTVPVIAYSAAPEFAEEAMEYGAREWYVTCDLYTTLPAALERCCGPEIPDHLPIK